MSRKILRALGIGIPALILAHLVGVALWSLAVVDEVVAAYSPAQYADTLSSEQKAILLKVVDPTFFTHSGVALANGQGSTTVTSSLARDVFLFHSDLPGFKGTLQSLYRTAYNCCKKIDFGRDVMAVVLNSHLNKERQLALFAQQVYMGRAKGEQLRGFARASIVYFGKPLSQASDTEFVGLVGMMKAPNLYNPITNRPAYDQRAARVSGVAAGKCVPDGWFDTSYEHCAQ